MTGDCGGKLRERRFGRRRPNGDRIEGKLEAVECRQALGGLDIAFVGQVVSSTGKAVDRDNGRAQRLRHKQRGDGEIFVMSDGHAKTGRMRRKDTISLEKTPPREGVLLASRPSLVYTDPFGESGCESGGIGRRTGFRFQRGSPWGFESPLSHHRFTLARICPVCKRAWKPSVNSSAS